MATTRLITHRNKPSMAESGTDDQPVNLLYKKIRSFMQSITSVHLIYLLLAFVFLLLSIFYSTLAMRGEGNTTASSTTASSNPFAFIFGKSPRNTANATPQVSLLSDRASLKFVLLLILFYLLLAGIETSCMYLTFLFGIELKLSPNASLRLQLIFFLGLLSGRTIDVFIDYGCFLFNTRITNRTKKQSDKFQLLSIKLCILIRLILLVVVCSTLSFSHLFQENGSTSSSMPSAHVFYAQFFLVGLLIASLPTLILVWIERDLSLNDSLIRILLITITMSEIIFPPFLFHAIQHAVLSYLFYLFIGSCCLLVLFTCILYTGKKWQRKKLYRILPTSMDLDDADVENQSDPEQEEHLARNGRFNMNGLKPTVDNERTKGSKGH